MATREDSRRYLENWQDEIDSAAEYRAMAESEPDARLARVYGNLARMAGSVQWAGTRSGQGASGRTTVSARTSAWSWAWPEPPLTRRLSSSPAWRACSPARARWRSGSGSR